MKRQIFTNLAILAVLFGASMASAQYRTQPWSSFRATPTPTPVKPREKIPVEDLIPNLEAEAFIGALRQGGATIIPVGIDVTFAKEFVEMAGKLSVVIPDLYLTEIEAQLGISPQGSIPLIEVAAQLSYLAYRVQNLKLDENEQNPTGYRFTVSASSGLDYEREPSQGNDPGEYMMNFHVIGPRAEIEGLINGHSFKLTMGFHLDYAVVGGFAVGPYLQTQFPAQGFKIGDRNRYLGQGHSTHLQFEYGNRIFTVGAGLYDSYHKAEFIEDDKLRNFFSGLDIKDSRFRKSVWLEVRPKNHWAVELGAEVLTLKGRLPQKSYLFRDTANRLYLKIKYQL